MHSNSPAGQNQRGVALILTMLLLILFSVFALGLYTFVTAETRTAGHDYFSNQSFYAAMAGIEKMTNDVNKIYSFKNQPTEVDFPLITASPPGIDGYTLSEYRINFNGPSSVKNISSGPYEGLVALSQPYALFVTAAGTTTKSETRLRRDFLTNLIPLFQFGIFYDGDLEAHAGPNFNFGGRVHTNRDFYITAGAQTVFNSRVTVVGEVVRDVRKNGDSAGPPQFAGDVTILDANAQPQTLIMSGTGEGGSVIGGPGRPMTPPGSPNSNWANYSPTKFGGNLLNGLTGARALRLPLQVAGSETIELIRRGKAGDSSSPAILQARYFYKPGLRISLSNATDLFISDPTLGSGGCVFTPTPSANRCAITTAVKAIQPWLMSSNHHLRVEILANNGTATDVTQEFLNLGITDDATSDPDAIIRLQRHNVYEVSDPSGIYPITFYDLREGEIEDNVDTLAGLSGVMTAMEINMTNLGRWLSGAIGTKGTTVPNNDGYVVYTSDRRGEIVINGEYDYEDTIFRNELRDPGEDLNANGVYDNLERPNYPSGPLDVSTNAVDGSGRNTFVKNYLLGNSPLGVTFRRCLRLVKGTTLAFPTTVASENPIYIQGDYNKLNKKPASIVGDAITILSTSWNDKNSFNESVSARPASDTTVQAAFIAGSTLSVYASPAPSYSEPHSNGGVHNLMRFLENWSGKTMTYVGSLVNLYTSRQAIGQWKCCTTVYRPPARNWSFDVGFLNPANLPPATPHITIVEIQRFRQDLYQALAP